ncbi:ribulose-phosphate 3-epimerase [Egicoccus sp. AB-alg6-2]|uniref:ribulose-phosphate 3-epimerase n=1 Tax=Egicoccus sp. AB-alg6-2 TaxID=3242692 RepID=UPI00359E240C
MHDLRVAPSILSADFARLADEVADVAPAVRMVHVDVMDGHYVPNLTLGPPVVRSLRAATELFLDAHLMISDPRTYAPQIVAAGADSVTFHPEVEDDPLGLVELLRDAGSQVGVAIRPHQPLSLVEELLPHIDMLLIMTVQPGFGGQAFQPDVVPKIAEAVEARASLRARFRIEVDGGISVATVGSTAAAGADTFVAGSAVFDHPDRVAAARAVLDAAHAALGAGAQARA